MEGLNALSSRRQRPFVLVLPGCFAAVALLPAALGASGVALPRSNSQEKDG